MPQMEDPWTKWGVVIAFGALLITYSGTASQLHWPPFRHSNPHHTVRPSPSSSPLISPSTSPPISPSASPSTSPSTSFSVPSEEASFVSAGPLGPADCQCSYQYSVDVNLIGLLGESCTLEWWTVYNASGLDAGTSGREVTGTLSYNNDYWRDTFNVTVPSGANEYGWQWHTVFAVYAPDGTELAEDP